jgi:hypothetical protein
MGFPGAANGGRATHPVTETGRSRYATTGSGLTHPALDRERRDDASQMTPVASTHWPTLPRVPADEWLAGTQQVRHCPREGTSRNTLPLKIPARGAPYAHMITCPSSLEVRRLDRRADSTTEAVYLQSQKLGPELGVKGRRVRTPQGVHQRPLRRKGCRGRLPPTDHRRHLVSIDCLRRALGVPKLPATHGQSRAQAVVHAPLNRAVRRGGLPVSSWFPS